MTKSGAEGGGCAIPQEVPFVRVAGERNQPVELRASLRQTACVGGANRIWRGPSPPAPLPIYAFSSPKFCTGARGAKQGPILGTSPGVERVRSTPGFGTRPLQGRRLRPPSRNRIRMNRRPRFIRPTGSRVRMATEIQAGVALQLALERRLADPHFPADDASRLAAVANVEHPLANRTAVLFFAGDERRVTDQPRVEIVAPPGSTIGPPSRHMVHASPSSLTAAYNPVSPAASTARQRRRSITRTSGRSPGRSAYLFTKGCIAGYDTLSVDSSATRPHSGSRPASPCLSADRRKPCFETCLLPG
jgi:hypothetical protein